MYIPFVLHCHFVEKLNHNDLINKDYFPGLKLIQAIDLITLNLIIFFLEKKSDLKEMGQNFEKISMTLLKWN